MQKVDHKIIGSLSREEKPSGVSLDSWWRAQSATVALLKHAYGRIEQVERELAAREERIRELESLASTDPLTGLMNRRGFEQFFEQELARIRRGSSQGALLVLIDLDRFKQINDKFGHQAGDTCLRIVAEHLLGNIRVFDAVVRFGGDEFGVLLTQTDPEKAMLRVKKIKQVLNDMTFDWQGEALHFGASVGMAPVKAAQDYLDVYQEADRQLYADKWHRRAVDISSDY